MTSNLEIIFGNQAKAEIEKELSKGGPINQTYNKEVKGQHIEGANALDGAKSPLTKSKIIRCPVCGSFNIYLGIAEIDGVPILCYQCDKTSFVKEKK